MRFSPRGSKEDLDLREKIGLTNRAEDVAFIIAWLGKLILFGINQPGVARCAGLDKNDCSFLQLYGKKDTWIPSVTGGLNLVETKVIACKFLASGAFVDSERFLPALFASADPNSRISDIGDDVLKRAASAVSLEDSAFVKQLFDIYLGTRGIEGSLPARPPLQTKILSLLCKSQKASFFMGQSTQIIEEALTPLDGSEASGNASAPKQGLEASKLKSQIFAFTNWLARISSPVDLRNFAPGLVSRLRLYIGSQGWPRIQAESNTLTQGELASRAFSYESIGLLAAACPDVLLQESNLELLRWLFTSLSEDSSGNDTSSSIEQALSSVLGAFGNCLNRDLEISLTSLLLHHMSLHPSVSDEDDHYIIRSTRFIAVRFANRCLPFSNPTARWIDILAMDSNANERNAILEDGRKGLDPYWHELLNPAQGSNTPSEGSLKTKKYGLPKFPDLVKTIFGSNSSWDISTKTTTLKTNAYIPALTFCRCVLLDRALTSVGSPPVVDGDWERNIDALVANNEDARSKLVEYFRECFSASSTDKDTPPALELYLQASYFGITSRTSGDVSRAGDFLLELCFSVPSSVYRGLAADISSLSEPIFSTNKTLRDKASHVFGILASLEGCPIATVQTMLSVFSNKLLTWRQAIGGEVLDVHGAILATTYFLSRSLCRDNLSSQFHEMRDTFILSVLDILDDSRDTMLLDAVFVAVADLGLFGILIPSNIEKPRNASLLVQKLGDKAKIGDEKAISAMGHLAIHFPEEHAEKGILEELINSLYDLHVVRQAEVQFSIGAALCCAAVGWQSKSLISAIDMQNASISSPSRDKTLTSVLERVLSDCKTTKPALRQASVIWLLCLVQYCGHMRGVQDRLQECQIAFKGFLADRDSLNQESASRGLTLVYEKGNRALKDDLIRDLVGSFTGTNAGLAGNVSGDTELFDAGALPTGEGNSVTTYKDIMSLAAEVGDSSLIYRFMSLASNNAIWSSRAAFGRFGLSNILSDASTDGYLAQNPKLYPALFRYRFDPNTNVRNSMNDIWAALVKEPTKTIDRNFDRIMDDLLIHMLGKEWRVRQASCAAVADLVQGRPLEMYEKYLTRIWELTFKVCDDIKESVRTAAMSLARVLTGILTRGLEAGEASARSADKMLKQVLPFLLSPSGLESGAPDVQEFARKTLLKIIKSSNGNTLRPFVPDLVGRLLALLSSIEPEMVNYLHLNAEKYGVTAQELDDARLKHIKGSSMLEAIERCLDYLDESSMPELQQSLENAIKTVVGLPSKVGCSRVLVSLSTRQNFIFKTYADRFIPLARKQVFDRNDTISSSYAAALGHLARLASDEALLKLVESCRRLYFDSSDDRHRVISGDITYAISKYATDQFNSLAGEILPFVFVAKHDTYDRARTLFEETWSENVGGSRAVLLYLREIVDLALQYLDSARWSVKHTSAFAIADVVMSAGNIIDETNANLLWPALERALSGKTWDGKEKVLIAFIKLLKASTSWSQDFKAVAQFEKIVLRESKRNNASYRQHALICLGDFVDIRDMVDLYPQVYDITKPVIEEILEKQDEMDVDLADGGLSSKTISDLTVTNAMTALIKSINPHKRTGSDLITSLVQTLELLHRIRAGAMSRVVANAIFDAPKSLFENLNQSNLEVVPDPLQEVLIEYSHCVFGFTEQVEQTRLRAIETIIALAPVARKSIKMKKEFEKDLAMVRAQERSMSVLHGLDRAMKVLER